MTPLATVQDELIYANFPKEYKLLIARLAVSKVPINDYDTRKRLFEYLSKHE